MPQVTGTLRGGVIIPETPIGLPDGSVVRIDYDSEGQVGMREEDWPTTPEGIERLIGEWEAGDVPRLTPEERAETEAFRAAVKRYTIEAVRKQMGLP